MDNSNKLADLLRLPLIAENIRVGDFVTCLKTEGNKLRSFMNKRINSSKLPEMDLDTSIQSLKLSMDYKNGSVKSDSPIKNKESTPSSKKTELTIGNRL